VLAGGELLAFVRKTLKRPDNPEPRIARLDDIVDVPVPRGIIRVGEFLLVFFFELLHEFGARICVLL